VLSPLCAAEEEEEEEKRAREGVPLLEALMLWS